MPGPPPPKSIRHSLRFSVRGLIILVLVIGGWLGWQVRSARIQRESVAAIRRAGGGVTYGSQYLGGTRYDLGAKPWWCPRWLVGQVGIDCFDRVAQVVFANDTSRVTDDVLLQISKLDRLEWLALDADQITDTGLGNLRNMTSLTRLSLATAAVGDSGLAHLRSLRRLEALDLAYTGVGDTGLAHLKGLTNLVALRLERTRVTDAGLPSLRGLTSLAQLDLTNTAVTDAGLRELQKSLPNVKIIR
jgi:Leucine-rich repeat (LRR) protein